MRLEFLMEITLCCVDRIMCSTWKNDYLRSILRGYQAMFWSVFFEFSSCFVIEEKRLVLIEVILAVLGIKNTV